MENTRLPEKLYLGLDLSTQQLKGVAINDRLEVVHEASVHFDSDLPEFRTAGGVHRHADKQTVSAPPLMWVKAVDMLLERLKITGLDFAAVSAISGSGQQHGSVYWKRGAQQTLLDLKPDKFLHQQLEGAFALRDTPIWMDSSTGPECKQLEDEVGGPLALARLTGSRAYERFTGSQIMKIHKRRPEVYQNTERISLVSSFGATLFLGKYASIDISDGSGMNLLDIATHQWSDLCLNACGTQLKEKLGETVPSWSDLGPIASYFVERYGFLEDCRIVAFTGDNPASLIGMTLREGDVAVSLGTSDTIFLWLTEPRPALNGHILCNPIDEKAFLSLICFKNGSQTRERISGECAESNWSLFNELLDSTPRGNFGNIGFYFDLQEIYPPISGDFRFNKFNERVTRFSKEVEVRACVEGQFLRLRAHAQNLGYSVAAGTRVLVTGGASANASILQVLADVFNASVYVQEKPNSAALGAAFLAKYAFAKKDISYHEMTSNCANFTLKANPSSDSSGIYTPVLERYKQLEDKIQLKPKE